jgi:hypothetical protein
MTEEHTFKESRIELELPNVPGPLDLETFKFQLIHKASPQLSGPWLPSR